ncbi:GNAT family N-acetyltransferase [Microvirga sp. 0TCS3.31]
MPTPRLATPSDLPEVENIIRAAYSGFIDWIGREPGPMLDDYASLISQGQVYVLEDVGIVGVLVLVPEPDTMLLDNVAIAPSAQGRGYGRLLLDFAEQEARRQGFGAIRLYTNSLMTENLRLYPRRGYVETHRGREKGFSRVYMTKQL